MTERCIEVRRHTMRIKPDQHISQPGVDLARRVGEGLGPFYRVITSTVPRAFETAIAMGFAVDEQDEWLNAFPPGLEDEVAWDAGFAAFGRTAAQRPGGITARFAAQMADFMRMVAESLPESGRALVITHGGVVEAIAVGCLPDGDHAAWGPACGLCEGVRLFFADGRFTWLEVLRV